MLKILPISSNNFKGKGISQNSIKKIIDKTIKSEAEVKAFEKGYNDVISGLLPEWELQERRMSAAMSGSPTSLRYLEGMAKAKELLKTK